MAWTIRLEAPGLDPLPLDSANGWHVEAFDPGDANIREQSQDAPDADGSIDTTSLRGERAVTLRVTATPDVDDIETMERRLRAFTNVQLRPTLYVMRSDGVEKQMTLRASRFSGPVALEQLAPCVVQWICPSGILESAVLHEQTIYPGTPTTAGLEFDGLEFDGLEFPLVDPPGLGLVVNAGDRDAYPVIRAFGPFGDEDNDADLTTIGNETTGKSLVFAGTGISAGDYLEIDVRARTIRVNGDASSSRYDRLVFPDSDWFTLAPGTNEITFRPDTSSGNAQMLVRWRSAYS